MELSRRLTLGGAAALTAGALLALPPAAHGSTTATPTAQALHLSADPNVGLSQCWAAAGDGHDPCSFLALDVAPRAAYANIMRLRSLYPDVYGSRGFFDAVNPTTGSVGHRILLLDQSMIMAGLDNALRNRALQRHFAADPVSAAALTYLGIEHLDLRWPISERATCHWARSSATELPPSTTSSWPVVYAAPGVHSHATAEAISRACRCGRRGWSGPRCSRGRSGWPWRSSPVPRRCR